MSVTGANRVSATVVIERAAFPQLLDALKTARYKLLGPKLVNGAIVYEELAGAGELPAGWAEDQMPGVYKLKRRIDEALFGYTVGPHSWKKFLHPAVAVLWQATKNAKGFDLAAPPIRAQKLALLGVRPCDLHAISILDTVLGRGPYKDPVWAALRKGVFVLAVNCVEPGGTCFCASMNTGPRASFGFDIALTEVVEAERHFFVATAGTERGSAMLEKTPHRPARPDELDRADQLLANAASKMGRKLDTTGLKELLYRNHEHPRWDNVAGRCLSCASCTMVCPTCFCTTVEDTTDVTGRHAARVRKWDSCFTLAFSFIHGGPIRASVRARYRHWLTHKFATWLDQFGTFGCVGCGRCITWCPAGIDVTEEIGAIRHTESAKSRKEAS
ncbi:MAG: 4Fe-4S dicluster domain-containing protein [Verrucomicrobiae bacterium]|nr:4Fe-4S dicluster domain-containing protein [Verrucomicrobiae bacterium]MCX7721878.1 4Fe-4S dicluster domain-containing protein [Verrucomicrobiae bacterium]MDW7980299.1 4Fe-4S dicluster domain-containing protein [Verrucomicrobiales bacterium]